MIIYKIINLLNQKIYIGQTTRAINIRMNEHINKADKNSCMLICRAINKHGPDNFRIDEIDKCNDKSELDSLEKYWINFYDSDSPKFGYNLTKGGDGGDIIGNLPNKLEIYKRRADSNRGRIRSEECRKRISDANPNRGKKMSYEQKQKLREHNLGKNMSDGTKNKISNTMKGRIISEEHKKRISNSTLGKSHPNAQKKISVNNIIYDSLTDASNKLNLSTSIIHYRLNSISNKFNDYQYL